MKAFTVGTHNLHDEAGTPTPFAAVLLFTEAIPREVRRVLSGEYRVVACPWQRDLVIAFRRELGLRIVHKRYRLVHVGIPLVTPHRGTFWLVVAEPGGEYQVLFVEHRINAAFRPWIRGERWLRARWWRKHTDLTKRKVRGWRAKGWPVTGGGDLNTPIGVSGFEASLREVGAHFDRLGSTYELGGVEDLGKKGSDHRRLKATATPG